MMWELSTWWAGDRRIFIDKLKNYLFIYFKYLYSSKNNKVVWGQTHDVDKTSGRL